MKKKRNISFCMYFIVFMILLLIGCQSNSSNENELHAINDKMETLKEQIEEKEIMIEEKQETVNQKEKEMEKLLAEIKEQQAENEKTVASTAKHDPFLEELSMYVEYYEINHNDLQSMIREGVDALPEIDWIMEVYVFMPVFYQAPSKFIPDFLESTPPQHEALIDEFVTWTQMYSGNINEVVTELENHRLNSTGSKEIHRQLIDEVQTNLDEALEMMHDIQAQLN